MNERNLRSLEILELVKTLETVINARAQVDSLVIIANLTQMNVDHTLVD